MGDNPFAVNDNPFATNVNGSVPSAAGAWNSSATGAWGSSSNGYTAPAPVSVAPAVEPEPPAAAGSKSKGGRRGADLSRREADLTRREAELRRLEMELQNNPASKSTKNWPKFCPILHHDIAGEIPAGNQTTVRQAYFAYLGCIWCLFFNFIGTSATLIGINGDRLGIWLWSALYLLGGIPGAYILWYSRLYNASIKDSAFGYAFFFAGFMAHMIFTCWSAIAPPILSSWSHTGFMSAISVLKFNTGVGIVYFIGAGFWSLEFLWSMWVIKSVYRSFRGQGMTGAQVQREAAARVAAAAV